jgi:probable phosphomutase (TIGR03848 family)
VTLLLLIRHAVTEVTGKRLSGATPGIHLSEEGRAQAARLSERLAPLRLSGVYASPLERCTETAEAIAAPRGLEVQTLPDLVEVGYGTWTGRPLAQLARTALWKRIQQSPSSVRFPGGEALSEVQWRCVAALDGLAVRHPRGLVAAVSHADVIRLAVAHYAGVHLDLFQRIIVSPASITVIGLGDRIPRIIRMNDTGSLDDFTSRRGDGKPLRKGP